MGEFFVRRPVFAMVIAVVMVLFGLQLMQTLPVLQYPDITPPIVEVSATYTGANAVDVEQSVATPIEQKVNGVEDMIYMQSINSSDGRMRLRVSFDVGKDLDMANVLTQNRVSEATSSLPSEVTRMGVTVKKSLSFPLMLITLTSPGETYDSNFMINYAKINLVDAISRIAGVGQVSTFGGDEYAMRVWIKPDQLAKLQLTVADITQALREQNVIAPAGQLGAEPAPPGTEFTYTVQTAGRLQSVEEFSNVVVRSNPDGSQVRIKDIARVELGAQSYATSANLNQTDASVIVVYQSPGSNGLQVVSQVSDTLKELEKRFPEDLEYRVSLDTTKAVEAGIEEIKVTLFQAVILVILVVFLFLQDWRATLIPLIAIPVSLIATFVVFPMLGFSINTLSLLGLVLAIGTVVDDAIVVVESVSLHIENGMSPKDATIRTMKEVTGPVIATSLALVAVFVPVGLMGGITGRLYQQFAITIAVSVMFSSLNALTLSPALSALLLRPKSDKKNLLDRFFDRFNQILERTTEKYVGISKYFVGNLKRSLLFLIIIVIGTAFLGRSVPSGFMPEEDQGYLLINIQLPSAASLQRTKVVNDKIDKILAETPGIEYYTSIAGYSLLSAASTPNSGFIFVALEEWSKRTDSSQHVNAIIQSLNRKLRVAVPEAIVAAFGPPAIPGLGSGSGFSLMLQDRTGESPQYLQQQAYRFIAAAVQRPEIASALTVYQAGVPQVFLDVDRDKVLKLGVTMNDVNTALGAFLGGSYVNDFNRFGRLYKVYVQAEPEYRLSEKSLNQFFVRGNEGQMVPLDTLLTAKRRAGPDFTTRFNLFRAAEILGGPAPGYSSADALNALEEVAHETLPPSMSYSWSNMSYQEKEAQGKGSTTFLMALLFVFLILAAQYESWSLPFSVLLGTPFAVFGAFLGLFLSRLFSESYVNNVFAQIGLVLLIGLAAKNAILIVEFAKMKREEGLDPIGAALEAARLRFRPILMTAFSFILGVLPLLVATGAGAEARKVMGMAVFAGMLAATVLGICLVPVLYVLIETLFGKKDQKTIPSTSET